MNYSKAIIKQVKIKIRKLIKNKYDVNKMEVKVIILTAVVIETTVIIIIITGIILPPPSSPS